MIHQVIVPQTVKVRKYEVDRQKLVKCLREHKTMSNKALAVKLQVPITEVEHWFRTDSYGSIPDADLWLDIKQILEISTNEFDLPIMEYENRIGTFEKAERCYMTDGIAPTLLVGDVPKIICK